jgi:sulfate transport system substrate-binding protein
LAVPFDDLFDVHRSKTIVLYGFSVMREVINDSIVPLFCEYWKEKTGESVEFVSTFAGSGLITNRIITRIQPEIAILASELDALRLREHGILMFPSRERLPHRGVVSRSPMVILVRSGNPKAIRTFDDLAEEGVKVVLADPHTSGSAQWSLIAAYREFLETAYTARGATERLLGLWNNVGASRPDARSARELFLGGTGDALITYEAEAIGNPQRPATTGEIIYPETPFMSEHIVMAINKNIQVEQRDLVNAFLDFLWSEKAQRLLVDYGFRSVHPQLNSENASFLPLKAYRVLNDFDDAVKVRDNIINEILAVEDSWDRRSIHACR